MFRNHIRPTHATHPVRRIALHRLVLALGVAAGTAHAASVGVTPPPPPGSTLDTQTFANNDLIEITPIGTPTITSSITVANMASWIWDVDVAVDIPHEFTSDLQMTITSPAGTVVTLVSNPVNEETFTFDLDDVLVNSLFDDQANPGGVLPFVVNAGSAADHPYLSNVSATPLAPTEALSTFRGENPNGVWTLAIADRFDTGGGSLRGWTLGVATLMAEPAATSISGTNSTVFPLPLGVTTIVNSPITIMGAQAAVVNVSVQTFIPSTNSADIDMTLTSPQGTVVTLSTDNGSVFDNVFNGTKWSDDANPGGTVPYGGTGTVGTNPGLAQDHPASNNVVATPLAPEEALGAFSGEDANGVWTLTVRDDRADAGSGSLDSWTLTVQSAGGVPDRVFANGFE